MKLIAVDTPHIGFNRGSMYLWGSITLPFQLEVDERTSQCMATFMVVNIPSAYNLIMGRPTLNALRAVPSTYHQIVKFLTDKGIGVVLSSH